MNSETSVDGSDFAAPLRSPGRTSFGGRPTGVGLVQLPAWEVKLAWNPFASYPDHHSLERSPDNHLSNDHTTINGNNNVDAIVVVISDESLCGTRPVR
jgi:hypothetical protein